MDFLWYWNKIDFETLEKQVDNLKNDEKILETSFQFLNKKIESFKGNWILETHEIDLLNSQIKYHKELAKKKSSFLAKKEKFTKLNKERILSLYNESENSIISDVELDFIKDTEENELDKLDDTIMDTSYRDYIEKNVNILWEMEYLYEKDIVTSFYDKFTIAYLNYLESNYPESWIKTLHKNLDKWLVLNEIEIRSLVYSFFENNIDEFKDFNNKLEIKLFESRYIINTNDFKEQIVLSNNKKYRVSLLTWALWYSTDKEINEKIKRQLWVEWNIDQIDLINKYIEYLLKEKDIRKNDLIKLLEKDKRFNYLDFMEEYWLPESVSDIYLDMVLRKLEWKNVTIWKVRTKITEKLIRDNILDIMHNFTVLNKIIVAIESNGNNVDNNSWSSAKWYFQYLNWNKWAGRKKWEFSSFETALRRYYIQYSWIDPLKMPNQELESNPKVPQWIVDTYNDKSFDPKELSAEKQNQLFIVDIFNNNKPHKNSNWSKVYSSDFLALVLMWNLWWTEKLYKIYHHTAPDERTKRVIRRVSKLYWKQLRQIK